MSEGKVYSCHPTRRWKIGKFEFENSRLELKTEEEIAEFEKVIEDLGIRDRNQIKTLSAKSAEAMARAFVNAPQAVQGVGTTQGLAAAQKIASDAETQRLARIAAEALAQEADAGDAGLPPPESPVKVSV